MTYKFFLIMFCIFVMPVITSCTSVEIRPDNNTGKVFQDKLSSGKPGPEMVWLPAGTFYMGAKYGDGEKDEYPRHVVDMPKAFAVARYETTVAEFGEFVRATQYISEPEKTGGCHAFVKWWSTHVDTSWRFPGYQQQDNFPVVCVSWNDAIAYTKWLSEQTKQNYRLPTEAEWEYAIRGGTQTKFWWGDVGDCNMARCNGFKAEWLEKKTVAVGDYKANPFGLYDIAGNVWEWTASEYVTPYDGSEFRLSDNSPQAGFRTMRGGSWYFGHIDSRSSNRGRRPPTEGWSTVGIRVIREN